MFGFKKVIKENNLNNLYLLNNIKHYNIDFYKFVSNILCENDKIYKRLFDNNFPKFDIDKISKNIFEDIINHERPFLYGFNYIYFENLINKEIKKTPAFKYLKNKMVGLLEIINGKGRRRGIMDLFNNNISSFFLKVDDLIKVKLYNNCIANYETEKKGYGVKLGREEKYYEKEIVKYYFYFIDSIVSSATIAYLMFLSNKINLLKEKNDEFYTILEKMLQEINDMELVYKKGYELLENLYLTEYAYIEDENSFKIFIKMIDSLSFVNKCNDYLNHFSNLGLQNFVRKVATEQIYMNDEQLKNVIAYLVKNSSFESTKKLFEQLALMDIYISDYKLIYKKSQLLKEKSQYLKGDFSNLKNEEMNNYLLENIHSGTDFEKYLVKLFKDMGYEVKHTGKAGDQGCDILLKKNDKTYCVQAKYYKNDLDNTPVQEIIGSLKYYNGDKGVVITNSSFTPGAHELARINGVILINGRKLQKLINYLHYDNDINRDILDEIEYL